MVVWPSPSRMSQLDNIGRCSVLTDLLKFYIVGGFSVHALLLASLVDNTPSPTTVNLVSWLVALVMEVVILGTSFAVYTKPHRERHVKVTEMLGPIRKKMTDFELVEVLVDITRIFTIAALAIFYTIFALTRNARLREMKERESNGSAEASESSPLLATRSVGANGAAGPRAGENGTQQSAASVPSTSYGAAPSGGKHKHTEGAPAGWERPDKAPSRSWVEYLRGYAVFFPYLWPSKDRRLQLVVLLCIIIVSLQRAINVLVVIEVGTITNYLSGVYGPITLPWGHILLYLGARMLQGPNGFLGAARSVLWIPVSQYSYRELSVAAFEHVHSLGLDFHLGKKTGEVISAMGKGSSINTFLESVTFQVLPMVVDLGVAIGYFLIVFDAYYALVVTVITFWYIYLTIKMAQWRADIRREMVNADREEDAVKNDSMISYETVKYFNAERYEFERYRKAVKKYQHAEYRVSISLNLMNIAQNATFMAGLLVVSFIAAYQVTAGQRRVGDFVTLLSYMAQLQGPLNFFGTFYRMIQSAMINSERMLELFKEQSTVFDEPHAKVMPTCEGDISFSGVEFAYDERKPALRGLDFRCIAGTTTAFVGESGGGKSTIFRLLYRFYNVNAGRIQIDGNDVQDVTIDSVRSHIGIVPQDTVLFNETLMYNLKYANQDATDEDVFAACRAASIHDRILTFPDGYLTKVGERGLRLSGGEKQRVAIARTILKNPRIIMLDEATAALDTETEQNIQDALDTLGHGRTMLVIAHRLSTIRNADQILVINDGRVVERGTHDQLMDLNGKYKSMWRRQDRAHKAEAQISKLKNKADKLRQEEDGSASNSEDDADDTRGKRRTNGVAKKETAAGLMPATDNNSAAEEEEEQVDKDRAKENVREHEMLVQGERVPVQQPKTNEAWSGAADVITDGKPVGHP